MVLSFSLHPCHFILSLGWGVWIYKLGWLPPQYYQTQLLNYYGVVEWSSDQQHKFVIFLQQSEARGIPLLEVFNLAVADWFWRSWLISVWRTDFGAADKFWQAGFGEVGWFYRSGLILLRQADFGGYDKYFVRPSRLSWEGLKNWFDWRTIYKGSMMKIRQN